MPDRTTLAGRSRTEIVIVGAGILGLSTALALAELGHEVTILEANAPGWGASGRNGGQVNAGLKPDPDEVERQLGSEAVAFSYGAPTVVKELISRLDLDADYVNGGGYRAAINQAGADDAKRLVDALVRRGIPRAFHDAQRMAEATGTDRYHGALFDPTAGQLNPLKYTQALAVAAVAAGMRLFCDSPVTDMHMHGTQWHLRTPGGEVLADRMLLATNGYSGPLFPKLARSVMPVFSAIAASRPLPASLRHQILSKGEVLYETGFVTSYYRVDQAGRLLFGGRGRFSEASGTGSVAGLIAMAEANWPGLKAVGWDHGWNGRLAMTRDHYPHLHRLGETGMACLGFNGRGVALTTALGPRLALALSGREPDAVPFPVMPVRPVPFQPLWPLGAHIALGWHRLAG